jgi:acyl-CoA synthetase (AMP-forming)/AMP-acid ligase II
VPTLAHDLALRAARHGARIAVRFDSGDENWSAITYRQLFDRAATLAVTLRETRAHLDGLRPVLIALPSGLDYVVAIYGCLLSGATAITFHQPTIMTPAAVRSFHERLAHILGECDPVAVIGDSDVLDLVAAPGGGGRVLLRPQPPVRSVPDMPWEALPEPEHTALIQYTSGSTAAPKGVLVSGANLLHNARGIAATLGTSEGESATSWLPLFHDMGLVGLILHPLSAGMTVQLMAPVTFLRCPYRWLEVISQTRSVLTMAPDFAYALTARRVTRTQRAHLDLSSVRHMVNAAEPVRLSTIEAFSTAFAPHGLRRGAITPAYGLAEHTLCVTAGGPGRQPTLFDVSARSLHERGIAVPAHNEPARTLVSCGAEFTADTSTIIVDPDLRVAVPEGRVGEIWVSGPSVACGYRGTEGAAAFSANLPGDDRRWLRTGDLGVKIDGQLCVVGRRKDVFVRNGINHYLHELETTAMRSHPALLPGGAAAFAAPGPDGELLVLVHELADFGPRLDRDAVVRSIRHAVTAQHGLQLDVVALLRRGKVPKTTSGKLRRPECARRWVAGDLAPIHRWPSTDVRPGDRL